MTDEASGAERAFRWFFTDRTTGRIVIGQTPNLALTVFVCAAAADYMLKPGAAAGLALRGVKVASLTIWAVDEVVRGVNPWRRTLGAATLAAMPVVALARG